MRKTILFGQKFSVLGIGTGGGSLQPKIINVPADYPTLIEANKNLGRHYYIGGTPSVTDNDPTKTNTGQTFLTGQDIMWDGISAYFKVGDNAIWALDGAGNVKTVTPQNINMQGKGLKDINLWTTVGSADADYSDIQTAILAGKTKILVLGNFTQPTQISNGSTFVEIVILKRLKFTTVNFNIGSAGIRIRGEIETSYTSGHHDLFTGTGTLDISNTYLFDTSTGGATVSLSNMPGARHLADNCRVVLANNQNAGFNSGGNNSSFSNMTFIGGGSSSNGFVRSFSEVIIDNVQFSGIWDYGRQFILSTVSSDKFIMTNCLSTTAGNLLIQLTGNKPQLSNLTGKFDISLIGADNGIFSDLDIENLSYDVSYSQDWHYFSNVKTSGTVPITLYGNYNHFVNCSFNAAFTLPAISNNNQLLQCKGVVGFTNNGTNNAIIEGISDDETLSADSPRLLSTQRSIKAYADNIAKGITVDYYFSNEPDVAIPDYDIMFPADTGEVESTAAASIVAADTLIQPFITQTTEPNFTTLLAGIYDIHIHAAKTAGTKDAFIYAEFYKRTYPGGVETLLATSDNSAILTGSNTGYTLHFSLIDDEILNATDRLVVKFYGSPSGVGTDPTATLYMEGTNTSRIDIHTTSSSWMLNLQNVIYVNGAGNDANAGKNMGTPKLTIAAALTAAALQSPSSSNIITVKVIGGLRYSENLTIPSWVVLDMCDAIILGQITLGVTMATDSFYYANEIVCPASSEAIRINGSGNRFIRANRVAPSLNSTFITATGGAVVYADINDLNGVATGAKNYAITSGTHLYLNARRFAETVASTSDAASNVVAHIGEKVGAGITHNINHAGNFVFEGLPETGYVGFGGTNSTTYPQTKCMHHSGTLAAAGSFVSISAATLGINSPLQIVKARVWGWYPAASAWMPDANIWGEGINFRIGSTGVQIQTPAASTGMAGQKFHLVYEYQQTNFLQ